MPSHYTVTALGILWLLTLSACGDTMDRLQRVGKEPPLAKLEDPRAKTGFAPISWPTPELNHAPKTVNSLWQPGSKTFFRDQRARREGDILTVKIAVDDSAKLDNSTERQRDTQENLAAPSVWGMQRQIADILPVSRDGDETNLLDITGGNKTKGDGTIDRKEQIETKIAAIVTQVLPNGNLAIAGSQEIRVNYEVREVSVEGVVRPEDINSDNTIEVAKVAQARISYGGRGQLSDIQQPRFGTQLLDIFAPF